jgi:dipeptidase E
MGPGYGVDEGAGLHFADERLKCVVTSRPQARAYWVERSGGAALEEELPTRYLDVSE